MGYNACGVLTNGDDFLFFHILPEERNKTEKLYVFSSLFCMMMHDDEELCCEWTKENEQKILDALNSLEEGSEDYCGELAAYKFI